MILSENDHVVETLASGTAEKSLADRIQIRGFRRDVDNVDTRALSDRGKPFPNLPSLSRIKYLGPSHQAVASRNCCAAHSSLGERVTLKCTTSRVAWSMMKNAKTGRNIAS